MEKRTSIRRQAATMAPLSARTVSCPLAPPWRTRPTVSLRKWAAPRAVLARPSRSLAISTSPSGHGQQRVIAPLARVAVVARPLLGQTVCLADRRIPDGEWSSPGPAPADQARASSSRLTRSNWRTWPHRKLRRNVPRVDGALTTQPRVWAVCATRRRRQCSRRPPAPTPPGSASCRPGSPAPAHCPGPGVVNQFTRPRCWANVTGRSSPALATRRRSSVIWMRSGWSSGSICWVLLASGRFAVSQTIIPEHGSTFLPLQHTATLISSVDWG